MSMLLFLEYQIVLIHRQCSERMLVNIARGQLAFPVLSNRTAYIKFYLYIMKDTDWVLLLGLCEAKHDYRKHGFY